MHCFRILIFLARFYKISVKFINEASASLLQCTVLTISSVHQLCNLLENIEQSRAHFPAFTQMRTSWPNQPTIWTKAYQILCTTVILYIVQLRCTKIIIRIYGSNFASGKVYLLHIRSHVLPKANPNAIRRVSNNGRNI